jgi:hypothetical protein
MRVRKDGPAETLLRISHVLWREKVFGSRLWSKVVCFYLRACAKLERGFLSHGNFTSVLQLTSSDALHVRTKATKS